MSATPQDVTKLKRQFRLQNEIIVEQTRKRILEVKQRAAEMYVVNSRNREKTIANVSQNLEKTIAVIRRGHEEARAKLSQGAVTRDVHIRVNRSLEALEEFIRMQRESNIDEERVLAALDDPAISGSIVDRKRRASVSDLIQSVQRQLIQQTEFINVAAHELRTPIMPILINAEILEGELGSKSEQIESIRRNALRLQRLSENILNVARIDSNSLRLRKQTLDLNQFVQQFVDDRRRAVKKVPIVFGGHQEELMVDVDRDRIEQVVANLIDNAVKFTEQGEVVVSCGVVDGKALVSVRDSGPGIEPEVFPLLFTKFGAKSQGGTGLGLFICRGIVEAHGGSISARNNGEYGKDGATFEFTLPRIPERTADTAAAQPT